MNTKESKELQSNSIMYRNQNDGNFINS